MDGSLKDQERDFGEPAPSGGSYHIGITGNGLPQHGLINPALHFNSTVFIKLKKGYDVVQVKEAISRCPIRIATHFLEPSHPAPPNTNYARGYLGGAHYSQERMGAIYYLDCVQNETVDTPIYGIYSFAPELWKSWFPNTAAPKQMRDYKERRNDKHNLVFPATGGDILLHLKSSKSDLIKKVIQYLKDNMYLQYDDWEEWHGENSKCKDGGRNLFGYFDGGPDRARTVNAVYNVGELFQYADLGRISAALIGDEDSHHKNGSYCFTSIWIHDLQKFFNQPVHSQDLVIGKTKDTGEVLMDQGGDGSLPNTHGVRTHGIPRKDTKQDPPLIAQMFRQGASFVDPARNQAGQIFVAYSRFPDIVDDALDNMAGISEEFIKRTGGLPDNLTLYSKMIRGQYWYTPNLDEIVMLWTHLFPGKFKDNGDKYTSTSSSSDEYSNTFDSKTTQGYYRDNE